LQAIAAQPRVADTYAARLVADGDATEGEVRGWRENCEADFDEQYRGASQYVVGLCTLTHNP
jgi:hypothetical protein